MPQRAAEVDTMEACTRSTNFSDDYAHRGPHLGVMSLYAYRFYVRRIPRPSRSQGLAHNAFELVSH